MRAVPRVAGMRRRRRREPGREARRRRSTWAWSSSSRAAGRPARRRRARGRRAAARAARRREARLRGPRQRLRAGRRSDLSRRLRPGRRGARPRARARDRFEDADYVSLPVDPRGCRQRSCADTSARGPSSRSTPACRRPCSSTWSTAAPAITPTPGADCSGAAAGNGLRPVLALLPGLRRRGLGTAAATTPTTGSVSGPDRRRTAAPSRGRAPTPTTTRPSDPLSDIGSEDPRQRRSSADFRAPAWGPATVRLGRRRLPCRADAAGDDAYFRSVHRDGSLRLIPIEPIARTRSTGRTFDPASPHRGEGRLERPGVRRHLSPFARTFSGRSRWVGWRVSRPEQATDRGSIAARLSEARERTLLLIEQLNDEQLNTVYSPLLSPLAWDLGHIANFEELWLVQRVGGREPLDGDLGRFYDAIENPAQDAQRAADAAGRGAPRLHGGGPRAHPRGAGRGRPRRRRGPGAQGRLRLRDADRARAPAQRDDAPAAADGRRLRAAARARRTPARRRRSRDGPVEAASPRSAPPETGFAYDNERPASRGRDRAVPDRPAPRHQR